MFFSEAETCGLSARSAHTVLRHLEQEIAQRGVDAELWKTGHVLANVCDPADLERFDEEDLMYQIPRPAVAVLHDEFGSYVDQTGVAERAVSQDVVDALAEVASQAESTEASRAP